MYDVITLIPPVAAIGFSILFMLLGGGLIGAAVIFVIAKALGR